MSDSLSAQSPEPTDGRGTEVYKEDASPAGPCSLPTSSLITLTLRGGGQCLAPYVRAVPAG